MIQASIYARSGADAELRESRAGKPWCRLNAACEAGQDRETQKPLTQWLTVVAFGRVAEDLARVRKGETLSAIGRLELNRWTGADGQEREGFNLVADVVITARTTRPGGRKRQPAGREPATPFNDALSF